MSTPSPDAVGHFRSGEEGCFLSVHAVPTVSGPQSDLEEQSAELDRRNFDMQALLKSVEALHKELKLESLCRLLLAMARERLLVSEAAILLHDESAHAVTVYVQDGLDPSVQEIAFPADDGILWRLLMAGEPFSVTDLRGRPRFLETFDQHGLSALNGRTWVPLAMPHKVVGLLSLGPGRRTASSHDLEFLSHLASQAAVAINTALLYESIQVARQDLDRSLHKLSMLFDVTRALGAVQDLTRLLRMILERAIDSVDAEKGSLMLLDEPTDQLVIRVVYGLPDKEIERKINDGEILCTRFGRGEGVAGQVLETGEPVRVNNVEDDKGFVKREGSQQVRSILCVPLKVEGETMGVINITNRKGGGTFGPEDEEILAALGNQAALAIARTRLYEAAITDGLTGLFVRRFAMHRLGEEVKRARRYGSTLSLVMCDIDHFKVVNDTYGHQAGGAVIVAVSAALRREMREDLDVAGRYGGEEFVLILPATTADQAAICAERLRAAIEATVVDIGGGQTLSKKMSFGVAQLGPEGNAETLVGRADAALYHSKETGRNRVTIAPPAETAVDPSPPTPDPDAVRVMVDQTLGGGEIEAPEPPDGPESTEE